MRKFLLTAAACAACAGPVAAVESWYWNGKTDINDSGTKVSHGKAVQSTNNWVNAATGLPGIPRSGDIAIFDTAYPYGGQTIGSDVGTVAFGGLVYTNRTCNCNQGTVTVQTGGPGVRHLTDGNVYWNSAFAIKGTGEFPVYVANKASELQIQKNFSGEAGSELAKTGPGTINVFCNGYSTRTYSVPKTKLREGTFKISQYEGNVSKGHEFWFDSDDPELRLHLFYKRDGDKDYGPERYNWVIQGGALRESEAVQNHLHEIYSTQTNLLVFTGTPKVNPMTFTGRLTGNAGLKWNPTVASEFVFSGGASTSSGRIVVSNGTVRVADGGHFLPLASLLVDGAASVFAVDGNSTCDFSTTPVTLANGGTFALAAGSRLCAGTLSVDGAEIPAGRYSGAAGAGATVVGWIAGAGILRVGTVPEGSATATWTKAGAGDIGDAANWEGGVTPELGGGTTLVTVASTVSGATEMTLDRDVAIRGIDAQHKSWVTVSGTNQFGLGSGGLKTANGSRIVVNAPTELTASQTWTIRASGGMEVKSPVASFSDAALTVGGSGWIDWDAACPSLCGPLVFTNLSVRLKGAGSFGPAGAGPVYVYNPGDKCSLTYVDGTVVDRDLWLTDGSVKAGSGRSRITTPADATVTFNGTVCSSNTTTLALSLGTNSTAVFRKLFMSRNAGEISGQAGGRAVFYGPYHNRDRFTMSGGTLEFHARLNRMNGNMGTWNGGTVRLMTDYALEAANKTRRQTADSAGNSADAEQRTWVNPCGNAVLDLCGHDQSVDHIALHGGGGTVTSETAAVLYVSRKGGYWPQHNYSYGFSVPSGYSTANAYGYECMDRGFWTGGVTLSYEGVSPEQRFMMRSSSSTGCVEVVAGTLVFLRRAQTADETFDLKFGSANPFPRLAGEDGAWPNAAKAVVKGGTLVIEHSKAFGKKTDVVAAGGTVRLEAGVALRIADFILGGVAQPTGTTYGGPDSAAAVKPKYPGTDTYVFSGAGVLRARGAKPGVVLFIR